MAASNNLKIVSIILIVVGVGLIAWGFQLSDSLGNQVSETLTGASTNEVMYRYIGGAASLAVGVYLFFRK